MAGRQMATQGKARQSAGVPQAMWNSRFPTARFWSGSIFRNMGWLIGLQAWGPRSTEFGDEGRDTGNVIQMTKLSV